MNKNKEQQNTFYRNKIQECNPSSAPIFVSIKDLFEYEKPLQVKVTFTSDNIPILYENKNIFRLNAYFTDFFSTLTPYRKEDIIILDSSTITDKIEIIKIPGKKLSLNLEIDRDDSKDSAEKSSQLNQREMTVHYQFFTILYDYSETDSSLCLERTLLVKPIKATGNQVAAFYTDCVKLNSIEKSIVVIE